MKTIRTKVYQFNELSKPAKQQAIEDYLNEETFEWICDEAGETFNKFAELFGLERYSIDYLEPYRNEYRFSMDDNILELTGQRLATYIWNNYKTDLFKGKYYNCKSKKYINHPRVESIWYENSKQYGNYYYSAITLDNSCVLTGVCYDDDLLEPIYNFLNEPTNNIDFKDLINDCVSSLCKSVQGEIKGNSQEDAISDHFEANEINFTKDGKRFNQ